MFQRSQSRNRKRRQPRNRISSLEKLEQRLPFDGAAAAVASGPIFTPGIVAPPTSLLNRVVNVDVAFSGGQFLLQTGTPVAETDASFIWRFADWNRDGHEDLVGIKKSRTGTGTTEVHILSGATNYQSFLLQVGTPLHETNSTWDFGLSDFNRDGVVDLVGIKKQNTGTGSTEIHILSGAANFQSFLLQVGTPLHQTDSTWDFGLSDWNRDGVGDLVGIKKQNTGTGTTELHLLSGAANFQSFLLQVGTPLHQTDSTWDFNFSDWNRDGVDDLVGIKKQNTGTGTTELHVLSGAANFSTLLAQTGTMLHRTDSDWEFGVFDYNRDGRDDLVGVKKRHTGTNATEVHVVSGVMSSPLRGQLTVIGTPQADEIQIQTSGGQILVNNRDIGYAASAFEEIVVHAGDGDDDVRVTANIRARIDGGPGDDTLIGGEGNDTILGGAGIDGIQGRGGNDVIDAGAEIDFIDGGRGFDLLHTGDGADLIVDQAEGMITMTREGHLAVYGTDADDILVVKTNYATELAIEVHRGGAGHHYFPLLKNAAEFNIASVSVFGLQGNDTIAVDQADDRLLLLPVEFDGGPGDDMIVGGEGNDRLFGGPGNDVLQGRGGDDSLAGGDDDDQLHGEKGNDRLLGNAGNDRLFGEQGNDALHGGDGSDHFEAGDGDDLIIEYGVHQDSNDFDAVVISNTDVNTVRGGANDDSVVTGGDVSDIHCLEGWECAIDSGLDFFTPGGFVFNVTWGGRFGSRFEATNEVLTTMGGETVVIPLTFTVPFGQPSITQHDLDRLANLQQEFSVLEERLKNAPVTIGTPLDPLGINDPLSALNGYGAYGFLNDFFRAAEVPISTLWDMRSEIITLIDVGSNVACLVDPTHLTCAWAAAVFYLEHINNAIEQIQIAPNLPNLPNKPAGKPTSQLVVADDRYEVVDNAPAKIAALDGVLANDPGRGDGQELTARLLTPPAHGTIAMGRDGSFDYLPHEGYLGEDAFSYYAQTADGKMSLVGATVHVTVVAGNKAPVITVADSPAMQYRMNEIVGVQISDPDAVSGAATATLEVDSGWLSVRDSVSGGVAPGDILGNGSSRIELTGDLAAINATLAAGLSLYCDTSGDTQLTVAAVDELGAVAESRAMVAVAANSAPFQNHVSPFDVDNSGQMESGDVIALVSDLILNGARAVGAPTGSPVLFPDVDGDNQVLPDDLLMLVSEILLANRGPSAEGEAAAAGSGVEPSSENGNRSGLVDTAAPADLSMASAQADARDEFWAAWATESDDESREAFAPSTAAIEESLEELLHLA